jgi:DNA-binding IclR family transcriptional regulator
MSETNSLERMLAVLGAFTEERLEWTPEELMEKLDYSRPTLYRYLKTLKNNGFLASLPNAGFTLGPRVVELDYLLRRSDPLVLNGREFIEGLAARYPCTALLVRWYRNKVLCVDSVHSVENPQSSYPRGRPMPLARGAIARAIIAFLPRRQLVPIVERNLSEFRAVGFGGTVEEVLERLKKVRKAGMAVAHGEVTPGVVGIAAPVFDAGQTPIASLCVTISGQTVTRSQIGEIGIQVCRAATNLSEVLANRRAGSAHGKLQQQSH